VATKKGAGATGQTVNRCDQNPNKKNRTPQVDKKGTMGGKDWKKHHPRSRITLDHEGGKKRRFEPGHPKEKQSKKRTNTCREKRVQLKKTTANGGWIAPKKKAGKKGARDVVENGTLTLEWQNSNNEKGKGGTGTRFS